jgi:predicted DNA binding CopG/RHH family protein
MKRGRPPIPGLRLIAIRLQKRDIAVAKRQARRTGRPYQEIVRGWVTEAAERAS